ncbi:MAG TPA: AAA family ATPase [Phycisphaerae bacterium]|nr:AAA family ATPase [Phycisphaerae bacterium]
MIIQVRLQRFKRFKKEVIDLEPFGITLIAGGNNSGKSSLLHALAVWEFCKTAIEMERGVGAFLTESHAQGLGLGDDEFSPVAIPSLKHLWTNLRPQKQSDQGDVDGYTLKIRVDWDSDGADEKNHLEFGLALSNDRLFVRVTSSAVTKSTVIPVVAYLPPFAGITDKEEKVSPAIRRRRIGEGLAGAVLRNLLLEMWQANDAKREQLRGTKTKIGEADLRKLRMTDPWELLQQTLRTRFQSELIVDPFREEYHSYIRIELVKGTVDGFKLKRHPNFNKRDLMVEGSGFLQWLSVYALATSPQFDVLVLDEPDAHLHPTLQVELMDSLAELASLKHKQVLVATHSVELLRRWDASKIMEVRSVAPHTRYLQHDFQKVGLLEGLGSDYGRNLDPIRRSGRVLFVEGTSDKDILEAIAQTLKRNSLGDWPIWVSSKGHKERRHLFQALLEDFPSLVAVSLRDRDLASSASVGIDLTDLSGFSEGGFTSLKWRRRNIETYLLHPTAIARVLGQSEEEVHSALASNFSLAIGDRFLESDAPEAVMSADGKAILVEAQHALLSGSGKRPLDIAIALKDSEVCEDFRALFDRLDSLK